MSSTDYTALYNEYWSRSDRWGSDSFLDAQALADKVLALCGGGRLLDVGCGMGALVRTMLARGVDAQGVDVARRPIEQSQRLHPDRFRVGSVLDLPFEDGAFDVVVSTDVLEHIAESDVDRALAELSRVCRRAAFLSIATTVDRDATWHLTVRSRAWWEERLYRAGFCRHPSAFAVISYEGLDQEGYQAHIALLRVTKDDRVGALGLVGRGHEAAQARATLASGLVRPGDRVLALGDDGCLSRVLRAESRALRVESARDALSLDGHDAGSLDCIVRSEPRASDLGLVLAAAQRVLTPGGRLVLTLPASSCAGGGDAQSDAPEQENVESEPETRASATRAGWPVGVRAMIEQACGDDERAWILERVQYQSAGSRWSAEVVVPVGCAPAQAEPQAQVRDAGAGWWMVTLLRSPLAPSAAPFAETLYDRDGVAAPDGYHATDFARAYDNPWIVRAMVSMGLRATSRRALLVLAGQVSRASAAGSADAGAALCVRAYQALETLSDTAQASALLRELDAFEERALAHDPDRAGLSPRAAHVRRWRVSNAFVGARLALASGDVRDAARRFRACAAIDPAPYSPLLATKTVEACFLAGLLHDQAGDERGAQECWELGVREARRVLQGDWVNVWRDAAAPLPFALPEVACVVEQAARCAAGLASLAPERAGEGWEWRSITGVSAREREERTRRERDRAVNISRELDAARAHALARAHDAEALRDAALRERATWEGEAKRLVREWESQRARAETLAEKLAQAAEESRTWHAEATRLAGEWSSIAHSLDEARRAGEQGRLLARAAQEREEALRRECEALRERERAAQERLRVLEAQASGLRTMLDAAGMREVKLSSQLEGVTGSRAYRALRALGLARAPQRERVVVAPAGERAHGGPRDGAGRA